MSSIKPSTPVHVSVGSTIYFSYDEAPCDEKTRWQTSDPWVLAITNTGVATTKDTGTAIVTYQGEVELSATVYVNKINSINLDNKPEFISNIKSNSFYKDEYLIPLSLYLQDSFDEIAPDLYADNKLLIA